MRREDLAVHVRREAVFEESFRELHRRSAEEWLNNFKKSVHAWYITDQILHTDKNEQVLFFAAQTIRSKIQYNFHELPVDSHEVSFTNPIRFPIQHTKQPINKSTPTSRFYLLIS